MDDVQNGGLCRTPEYLSALIATVGGYSKLVFNEAVNLGIVQGHHVFHVTGGNL